MNSWSWLLWMPKIDVEFTVSVNTFSKRTWLLESIWDRPKFALKKCSHSFRSISVRIRAFTSGHWCERNYSRSLLNFAVPFVQFYDSLKCCKETFEQKSLRCEYRVISSRYICCSVSLVFSYRKYFLSTTFLPK